MNERDSIAFELGYDLAHYGRDVPEDAPLSLCDGYRCGRRQFPRPALTDRFIEKWLQLRTNALRRDKRFDPRITQEYLKSLDVPFCPVTLEILTYGTGSDSDWSIDRCNNRLGYVPGNLILMSVKANAAKSNLLLADIEDRASRPAATDGLSPQEWKRLAELTEPAEHLTTAEPPQQFLTGSEYVPGQPVGMAAKLQAGLVCHIYAYVVGNEDDILVTLDKRIESLGLTKDAHRAFIRLARDMIGRIRRQRILWSYWSLKRPSRFFLEWWLLLSQEQQETLGHWADSSGGILSASSTANKLGLKTLANR